LFKRKIRSEVEFLSIIVSWFVLPILTILFLQRKLELRSELDLTNWPEDWSYQHFKTVFNILRRDKSRTDENRNLNPYWQNENTIKQILRIKWKKKILQKEEDNNWYIQNRSWILNKKGDSKWDEE
jgi:hypothetical protein